MTCVRSDVATMVLLVQMLAASATLRGSDSARLLGSYTPHKEATAAAFVAAASGTDKKPYEPAVKKRITDNWSAITAAVSDAGISNSKEFSMFMANVMQESGSMSISPVAESTSSYTDGSYDWGQCDGVDVPCKGAHCKSKCKVQYFGRGYLQTSWYKNYKEIVDAGKCTTDSAGKMVSIVENPDKVATDEKLAWCTAAYYWKHNVHDDRCQDGKCELGNTIHAINGALECGPKGKANPAKAQRRFCFYQHFFENYEGQPVTWADSICIDNLAEMCPVS